MTKPITPASAGGEYNGLSPYSILTKLQGVQKRPVKPVFIYGGELRMSKAQRGTMVEVFVKLQDMKCAEKVITAINSYFHSSGGEYNFNEIRDGGIYNGEFMLVFIASEQDRKEIADQVHQFLNSFMDEFYDETLEDDWLNEMDCEEMPMIVSYEVNEAKDYIGEGI